MREEALKEKKGAGAGFRGREDSGGEKGREMRNEGWKEKRG